MGMIDSVRGKCPCGRTLYFQSKSGPCRGDDHDVAAAPRDVLWGCNAHSPRHCQCGRWFEVDTEERTLREVADPPMEGPKLIRLSDGLVVDFRHASALPGEYANYFGAVPFGQTDAGHAAEMGEKT